MNYKLIHNEEACKSFIDQLPELKENESYFIILIARKKWFPESGMSSARKLKREAFNSKSKIIPGIKQWETEVGTLTDGKIVIDNRNLGVYIGYNPKDQRLATFNLVSECMNKIRNNQPGINIKSMANDVIQSANGSKNFIDLDVDIVEGETRKDVLEFIQSIISSECLTVVITNGGFHALVHLTKPDVQGWAGYERVSQYKDWYQRLQNHPFKSGITIMSHDLMPLVGCNQGQFVPYIHKFPL